MKIDLGKILNSLNLHLLIEKYWQESFNSKSVTFSLQQLEWIANSEVAFLIGWIRSLYQRQISVSIELQTNTDIPLDSNTLKRRKYCLEKLLLDWKIQLVLPKDIKLIFKGITIKGKGWNSFSEILPITIIKYVRQKFDEEFDTIYKKECANLFSSYQALLLKTDLNYLDTYFLNYSILKELFSNVCIHSDSQISNECYYSIGLNKRFSNSEYENYISDKRIQELSSLEKDYYSDNDKYRNIDFVEITFQDFGIGIVKSLKNKYLSETKESLLQYFGYEEYELHKEQNDDSKILHYALLLFTSQFEINRNFEIHDFIPRGLFIIQEIIEKYNGYLEILSGNGGIGVSYKNGVKKIKFVKAKNEKKLFPGTRVKLVFPSKNVIKKPTRKSGQLKSSQDISDTFNNIHFLDCFTQIETELTRGTNKLNLLEYDISIISNFFQLILKEIQKIKKGQIVLIDFAGIDKNTIDLFNKFIYFISHCPINTTHRIILYNVIIKDLNSTVIFNSENILKSKGFTPFPVPIINADLKVEWLGVDEKSIDELFTRLWIGDLRGEIQHEDFSGFSSMSIHVEDIESAQKISINLPIFIDVLNKIEDNINIYIQNEINCNGIHYVNLCSSDKDYNDVLIKKKNTYFLNPNGSYQEEYLSFNEKLYMRSYRKMLSTYFFFLLSSNSEVKITKINKILSVTLSSQFLGSEVKDLFERLMLTNVELIALSNYYNFQNEERFNDIKPKDVVLVVNDIISTGNLTENIFQSIEKKLATPAGCVSIVDLREEHQLGTEYQVMALTKLKIKKFETKPKAAITEWINPVLNSPVAIKKRKSNVQALFTQDEFLSKIKDKHILIGNIKNNSFYMNYFLHTAELFKDDLNSGFIFIKELIQRFIEQKKLNINTELGILIKGLNIIAKNIDNEKNRNTIQKINKQLEKINIPSLIIDYKIDIIFYPFLSKISILEENLVPFSEYNADKNIPLIYPIPRIMTPKGWRFSFPPKFLNIITTKGDQNILIIDDGSCTGATIMQMIDSISFLSVKSIDVLSIFGRLEDFQKELFSRIKSLKVKDKVVPVNLFYGVHFNLPVYSSSDYPHFIELREIEALQKFFIERHAESVDNFEDFLKYLSRELEDTKPPFELKTSKIPYDFVSKKVMLQYRDLVGKFDSFRFFSEEIPAEGDFSYIIKNDVSIFNLLSILNLEIHLYQTIKRIFSKEIINKIRLKILNYISDNKFNTTEPQQIFLIKGLFYIDSRSFIRSENLISLVNKMVTAGYSANAYRYIEYLLFVCGFKIRPLNDSIAQKSFSSNIDNFAIDLRDQKSEVFKNFRFFFETYRKFRDQPNIYTGKSMPANKYFQLSEYFFKVINNEGSHDEKLLPNHFNNIIKNIQELKFCIEKNITSDYLMIKKQFDKSLEELRVKYFELYIEYRLIKEIILDLKNHSNIDMDFNPAGLHDIIRDIEYSLKLNYDDNSDFDKFLNNINRYKEAILVLDSNFLKFIVNQKANIQQIWAKCETLYFKENDYVPIIKLSSLDHTIKINPYILKLTFDNLIKNKNQYAKDKSWEINIKEFYDVLELYIKQFSKFKKDVGDGTGQQSIKSILYNYGTLYKKINDNPYTIKITFTK